jgi:LuxR family maltose regulon positive regulatory protein
LESLERSPEMGMRAYVHINLASLHLECGEIEDCMSSLDMAVKECRTVKDIHAELMISSTRVQALDLAGKLDEAGNALAALDRFLEQYSLGDSLESSLAACPKMEMLYERNLLDEAVKTASPYLKMPIAELSITVITPFAYTLSALGKGDEALELLLKWDTALQNTPAWWVPDKISHCRAFLLRHNRAASGEWLKSTEDKSCMLFWDTALTAIQKSRFYCDRGMFKKAMETAAPMLDKADELKCFDISLKLRAVLAAAQFALSEKRQAMETLAPALRLGESQGYVRAFIDTGDIIVPLLKHAVGCELSVEYCMKLLSFADFSSTQERQVLTEREIEVLRLVSEGHSNVQIAKMLYLSPGTVKRHIYNISIKLGASNRVEAVAIAKRIGALK